MNIPTSLDLSAFTPAEQKLIADCFTRIKDLPPDEQEAIVKEMLPTELAQKVATVLAQNQQQNLPATGQGLPQTFKV